MDRSRSQHLPRPALPRGRRALRGLLGAPSTGGLSRAASSLTHTLRAGGQANNVNADAAEVSAGLLYAT